MTTRRIAHTMAPLQGDVFSDLEARARAADGPFFPLHYGDAWLDPMDAAYETLPRDGLFQYAPPCGVPAFLDIATRRLFEKTGVRRAPEQLLAVSGATSGIRDAVQALVNPGDEVLLPAPFWPLVRGTIWARGATPVEVPFFDRLTHADFDPEQALESAMTEKTRMLYLNTPHNPTGTVLREDVLACVARVAARHDLWVLADEVYEEVYFTDTPPPPSWSRSDLIDRTVAVHSMSKAYAMAGARVGFAHGPADAIGAMRTIHTYQDFGPAKAQQLLAAGVLREGEGWMAETRRVYAEAASRVSRGLGIPPIQGGTFAFAKLPAGNDDFLERCADHGVLLTPGRVCGRDYADWFRLSFTVVPPAALQDALDIVTRQIL